MSFTAQSRFSGESFSRDIRCRRHHLYRETRTGEVISHSCQQGLRDVSLECGGKNAAIVFDDCDLDKAIEGTMRSAFANCGQVCPARNVFMCSAVFTKPLKSAPLRRRRR